MSKVKGLNRRGGLDDGLRAVGEQALVAPTKKDRKIIRTMRHNWETVICTNCGKADRQPTIVIHKYHKAGYFCKSCNELKKEQKKADQIAINKAILAVAARTQKNRS